MNHHRRAARTVTSTAAAFALAANAAASAQPPAGAPSHQHWLTLPTATWNDIAAAHDITGIQRTITYRATTRILATEHTADLLRDLGVTDLTSRPASFTVDLAGQSFDPLHHQPAAPARLARHNDTENAGLSIIQFQGPAKQQWLDQLERDNCTPIAHVPPHTYIVWAERADRTVAARNNNAVRATADFLPAYKLQPRFRTEAPTPVLANVLIVNPADTQRTAAAIANIQGVTHVDQPRHITRTLSALRVHTAANALPDIATINGVYSVQIQQTDGGARGELANQLIAQRTSTTGFAFPGYQDFLDNVRVTGNAVTVAVVDQGTDNQHPDLIDNILPCAGFSCAQEKLHVHGTRTAAIIAGTASSGATDSNGFLRGLGVAPQAALIEQSYLDVFQAPGGVRLLINESHSNGALLSSNSWGTAATPQGYDAQTLEVDAGVRDADPQTTGNEPLAYVLAIMNGNGDGSASDNFSSLGAPDEAKNIIAVGSQYAQNINLTQDNDHPNISFNSAHGPALDGRIVPHIVAPGCSIDAAAPPNTYSPACGTSYAAPHVAGAAALFVEQHRNRNNGNNPSPALIKAALAASANSLEGFENADGRTMTAPPNRFQGWGALNIATLLGEDGSTRLTWDQTVTFDDTGQSFTTNIRPKDINRPLRIALAWTDAPGHGLGGSTPAWNNDLDLTASIGSRTYRGNFTGTGSFTIPGGPPDHRNNLETITLPPDPDKPAAMLNVTVSAADINSDGVPNTGDITDQDFALVCFNCTTEPLPACPDTNGDNAINAADLLAVLHNFGGNNTNNASDVNRDAAVDAEDLLAVLTAFGSTCDTATP